MKDLQDKKWHREMAAFYANRYLDIIRKDNTRPTYRWNQESHGVVGFIKWLENSGDSESPEVKH